MSKYVKKLGSDTSYKRPKKTYQEQLTAEEIAEKLQGYERVDNIADVPLNTHLRYFATQDDGTQVFRTGGFLHNKQNSDVYVMLSNGKSVWSVQVKDVVFFKKMSHQEEMSALHDLYKKKLREKDSVINKLKEYITNRLGAELPTISKTTKSHKQSSTSKQQTNKTNNKQTNKTNNKQRTNAVSNKPRTNTANNKPRTKTVSSKPRTKTVNSKPRTRDSSKSNRSRSRN